MGSKFGETEQSLYARDWRGVEAGAAWAGTRGIRLWMRDCQRQCWWQATKQYGKIRRKYYGE
jgi:hypothetical protein